jgi:hypothetical protein
MLRTNGRPTLARSRPDLARPMRLLVRTFDLRRFLVAHNVERFFESRKP